MRCFNGGSCYRVYVSEAEVEAFNRTWPCSVLTGRYWFEFDKTWGDLVDMSGHGDGPEVVALSEDAQAYGDRRLGRPQRVRK